MSKLARWLIALIIIVVGVWFFGYGPGKGKFGAKKTPEPEAPTVAGEAIKIGAVIGSALARSVELAVNELNHRNGIGGQPVRIIFEGGKCDKDAAATAAKKLIESDGVKYIIGGACGGETLGIARVAEASKVIVITPAETDPTISRAGVYIFRLAVSDAVPRAASTTPYFDAGAERAAEFIAAFQKKYSAVPDPLFASANAYTAVYLIKDLIEQYGLDTEKAIKSLQTLKEWTGGAHTSISFDRNGDLIWKDFR